MMGPLLRNFNFLKRNPPPFLNLKKYLILNLHQVSQKEKYAVRIFGGVLLNTCCNLIETSRNCFLQDNCDKIYRGQTISLSSVTLFTKKSATVALSFSIAGMSKVDRKMSITVIISHLHSRSRIVLI